MSILISGPFPDLHCCIFYAIPELEQGFFAFDLYISPFEKTMASSIFRKLRSPIYLKYSHLRSFLLRRNFLNFFVLCPHKIRSFVRYSNAQTPEILQTPDMSGKLKNEKKFSNFLIIKFDSLIKFTPANFRHNKIQQLLLQLHNPPPKKNKNKKQKQNKTKQNKTKTKTKQFNSISPLRLNFITKIRS